MQKKDAIVPILLLVLLVITGCSAKKYDFTIVAPPKYSSEQVFNTMEVLPFQSNKRSYGEKISGMLKGNVANEGYIGVVDSNADCRLEGTITISDISKNSRREKHKCTKCNGDGDCREVTCYEYLLTKKASIKADYTLYNNADSNVAYGDSVQFDYDKTWSSSESSSEVKAKAQTDEQILSGGLEKIATKITRAVTPHKETVQRELQKGSDKNIALGITYLENGRLEQAISIWDQCAEGLSSSKDKAAAYYNIGVVKESQGLYRDAFELYSDANSLLPAEELYIQAMTRAEKLSEQEKSLARWENL